VSQETCEAIVLRGVDFGDTSRIVTLLTPVRGRMACMAKGARRKNSPTGAVLGTLNLIEAVYYWKDGREVQTLGEVTLLDGFAALRADLERSAYAAFPLELVVKVAHANEPSQPLYDALRNGLQGWAASAAPARTYACWMVMQLLGAAGFAPVLDHCVRCGAALPAAPGFDFGGGAVCGRCPAERRPGAAAFAALVALQEETETCPRAEAGAEVFQVLRAYAARQVESEFRSTRVLQEMFGNQA